MTVQELCELFIEDSCQTIQIWSDKEEYIVWKGNADEAQDSEYAWSEISSIDNIETGTDIMTINIFDK